MLVAKDYGGLEALSQGVRLTAEQIEAGVTVYGRRLVDPPDAADQDLDVVQIQGKTPPAYSVRFRLSTEEEGRSDLELQATFIDAGPSEDVMVVEIDGVLVA